MHSQQRKLLKLFFSKQFYTSLRILNQKLFLKTMRSNKSWAETKLGKKTSKEQALFVGPAATGFIFGRTSINLLSSVIGVFCVLCSMFLLHHWGRNFGSDYFDSLCRFLPSCWEEKRVGYSKLDLKKVSSLLKLYRHQLSTKRFQVTIGSVASADFIMKKLI